MEAKENLQNGGSTYSLCVAGWDKQNVFKLNKILATLMWSRFCK
jgi:hypothetical protein